MDNRTAKRQRESTGAHQGKLPDSCPSKRGHDESTDGRSRGAHGDIGQREGVEDLRRMRNCRTRRGILEWPLRWSSIPSSGSTTLVRYECSRPLRDTTCGLRTSSRISGCLGPIDEDIDIQYARMGPVLLRRCRQENIHRNGIRQYHPRMRTSTNSSKTTRISLRTRY